MAYVVRKPGSNITEAQVIDFIAKQASLRLSAIFSCLLLAFKLTIFIIFQVAPYKKIRRVSFIDAIPKSPAGKILRRELTQHARSHGSNKL